MSRFPRRIAAAAAMFSVSLNVACGMYGPPPDEDIFTTASGTAKQPVTVAEQTTEASESGETEDTTESTHSQQAQEVLK